MTHDEIRAFLLCSLALAYAILMIWFAGFVFAHDAIYRLHSRWFRLPVETFDAVHYLGMAMCKIAALMLFAVPWLALEWLD